MSREGSSRYLRRRAIREGAQGCFGSRCGALHLRKGPVMARSDIRARAQGGRLLAAAIPCATGAPAAAEVRVKEAAGGRLVIEAHDATVQQILDALGPSRPIRFAASDALSRHVTGTYIGTLPRVLSRILEGYDYVIRSSSSGIKIDVVGAAPFGG